MLVLLYVQYTAQHYMWKPTLPTDQALCKQAACKRSDCVTQMTVKDVNPRTVTHGRGTLIEEAYLC